MPTTEPTAAAPNGAPAPGRPRLGRLRRAGNLVGAALLVLLACELVLRLAGWLLAPSLAPAAGDQLTVVCVGDSWTVGQPDGSYPALLGERLAARPGGVRYRVVNLGRSGTNSSQALRLLVANLDALRPHLVLVLTGNNDHWNLSESRYWRFREGQLGPGAALAARLRVALESVRLVRVARVGYWRLTGRPSANEFLRRDDQRPGSERADLGAVDPDTVRRQLDANLVSFVELSRRHGFGLAFLTYFHFHAYRVEEVIVDAGARHGVPVVNNAVEFHRRVPVAERDRYLIPDGHPNPRGYAFMADNVLAVLDSSRLLPPP